MGYAIVEVVKIFVEDYRIRSKSNSRVEYLKSPSRFFNPIRTRFSKPNLALEGIRTTYKDQKSKSLMRYDIIRINSVFKRD